MRSGAAGRAEEAALAGPTKLATASGHVHRQHGRRSLPPRERQYGDHRADRGRNQLVLPLRDPLGVCCGRRAASITHPSGGCACHHQTAQLPCPQDESLLRVSRIPVASFGAVGHAYAISRPHVPLRDPWYYPYLDAPIRPQA